jgi:hypothetical protein
LDETRLSEVESPMCTTARQDDTRGAGRVGRVVAGAVGTGTGLVGVMLGAEVGGRVDKGPAWLLPVGTDWEAGGDEAERELEEPEGNTTVSTMAMTTAAAAAAPATTHRLRARR